MLLLLLEVEKVQQLFNLVARRLECSVETPGLTRRRKGFCLLSENSFSSAAVMRAQQAFTASVSFFLHSKPAAAESLF